MASVAESYNVASSSNSSNNKFDQEFEDYRRACRERYQQHKPEPIKEEEEEVVAGQKTNDTHATHAHLTSTAHAHACASPALSRKCASPAPSRASASPANTRAHTRLSASTSVLEDSTIAVAASGASSAAAPELGASSSAAPSRLSASTGAVRGLNTSVEMVKKSGQRRNSFDKIVSFFSKKPDSPEVVREKEKLRAEREKKEQDFRMAAFIAQLQMEGRSDEEIQLHLFHIRDQSQFRRRNSNNGVGDFFRSMGQAFKDEFSTRSRNPLTISVSSDTPFYAAPPAGYSSDTGFTYEELVALESVQRGVSSLDHLPVITYSGQELHAQQTRCAICMGDFEHEEELRELVCNHYFHKECADKWLSVGTTCPICKGDVRCEHPAE